LDTEIWPDAPLNLVDFLTDKPSAKDASGKHKVSFGAAAELRKEHHPDKPRLIASSQFFSGAPIANRKS